MKKPKQELIDALSNVINNELKKDRRMMLQANKVLSKYNVPTGTINNITNKENGLNEVEPDLLCLITIAVFEVTGNKTIVPDVYFNEKEIAIAKRYEGELSNKLQYPIVFNNVIKLGTNDFVTTLSAQKIRDLMVSGIADYNFETQRTPQQRITKSGSIVQKPWVNPTSVKKISSLMLEEKYTPDMITFNVLFDGNDDIEYDAKDRELVIRKGKLDILDGFHRIQGMMAALDSNPELELNMVVSIKNYQLDKARWHFGQINTINIPDKTRIKEAKNETVAIEVVNELRRTSQHLKNRIASNTRISTVNQELTNSAVLADAIDEIFKPQSRKDLIDIAPFLRDFFDYLIESFKVEFVTNYNETRRVSWINHHNLFIGYVVLAKKFFYSKTPINKIVDIMNSIDFNKETSDLSEILSGQGKESSVKVKKKIKEYFEAIQI